MSDEARAWYAAHGRPWAALRPLTVGSIAGERVVIAEGHEFASRRLARRLAGASSVVVVAVSAGPEVDAASERLWQEERPDAAYARDRFAAAVAEHLALFTARHLRQAAAGGGLAALPGYSPGHDGWPLGQQVTLAACLVAAGAPSLPGPFEVLDSGMIRPKNSLLALFGLTADLERAARAWERSKCGWCSLAGCALRLPSAPRDGAARNEPRDKIDRASE